MVVAVLDAQRTIKGHGDRERWIDVARGIGIVLVVFGHVWRGIFNADLMEDEAAFTLIDRTIYLFHMPLFFILSGLFFADGILKRGIRTAFISRLFTIAYPYIIWTYLNVSLKYMMGDEVNSPINIHEYINSYYPPVMQFWFLFHLFFIQTILSFSFIWKLHYFVISACVAGVALLVFQTRIAEDLLPITFVLILPNFIYFVVGVALGNGLLRLGAATGRTLWGATFAFGGAQIAFQMLPDSIGTTLQPALALICALATLIVARTLTGRWNGVAFSCLSALGAASMAIFVAHVIFTAGIRVGLAHVGIVDLFGHCILGTAGGLLGPYVLFVLARRFRTQWQAGFGGTPDFLKPNGLKKLKQKEIT